MNPHTPDRSAQSLAKRRIGVPESRQLDLFADMLERRGAVVMRCPLVDIRDSPDADTVKAWLDDVIHNGLDDMIWLTGEGLRRLQGFAERAGGDRIERFIARLGEARSVTRGPKPVRVLRELGLKCDLAATEPTTAGVIDALRDIDLAGRRVGVQRYGTEPNPPLMDFLADKAAIALPVAPYIYADETEEPRVLGFIDAIINGEVDAVAFTSSPQIKRMLKVARQHERTATLAAALNRRCVAAVGPLMAERLREAGIAVTLMPESSFFMKPLVRELVTHFTARG